MLFGMTKAVTSKGKIRTRFGERLHRMYTEAGYTRPEFARKLGIRVPSLLQLEYGNQKTGKETVLSAENAIKAAAILDTTVEYLITGKGIEKPLLAKYDPDVVTICALLQRLDPGSRAIIKTTVNAMLRGRER